jgi:mRNA interferase MazF
MSPLQGEVWMASFSPVVGHEQDGTRPALVVSRDELNRTGLCMVVPGTRTFRPRPARVHVPAGTAGLPEDTWFLCDQLRTVDARRLLRRFGDIERKYLRQILTQSRFFLTLPEDTGGG